MTLDEVMAELQRRGNEQTKTTFLRHGAKEPIFGVKVGDLKVIQKRVKVDHELALALYATGNSDAMYLAGLIADPPKMTKAQLNKWMKAAYWSMLADYTVAWVAAESRFGVELARVWMDSPQERIAAAGWFTYASVLGITPDTQLNLPEIESLLDRVRREIGTAKNHVRYAMNNFVIAVGGFVAPLLRKAQATAQAIGTVAVDMGDTACRVPNAGESIAKMESLGRIGKKRKSARC